MTKTDRANAKNLLKHLMANDGYQPLFLGLIRLYSIDSTLAISTGKMKQVPAARRFHTVPFVTFSAIFSCK